MLVQHQDPFGFSIWNFQPRQSQHSNRRVAPPREPRQVATYLLPEPASGAREINAIQCRCEPTPVFEAPIYVEAEVGSEFEGDEDEPEGTPATELPSRSKRASLAHQSTSSPDQLAADHSADCPIQSEHDVPSLFPDRQSIRPGVNDFRVAVVSFELIVGVAKETLMGFIDISALFKHARLSESESTMKSPTSSPETQRSPEPSEPLEPTPESPVSDSERVLPDPLPSIPVTHPKIFSWPEWGPNWTRFYEAELPRAWVCFLYNNRFVFGTRDPPLGLIDPENGEFADEASDNVTYLNILDFNPAVINPRHPARKAVSSSEEKVEFGAVPSWLEGLPPSEKRLVSIVPDAEVDDLWDASPEVDTVGMRQPVTVGLDLKGLKVPKGASPAAVQTCTFDAPFSFHFALASQTKSRHPFSRS